MAEKPITSSFEDSKTDHSEVLNFTFNIGGEATQLPVSTDSGPGDFYPAIAGNIEFVGNQRPGYWRSIVALCAIGAIFSTGFYYLLGGYKTEMASYIGVEAPIAKVLLPQKPENPDLISKEIISQQPIDLVVEPKPIDLPTSTVERIEPKEKTEPQTQLRIPDSTAGKSFKKINEHPVQLEKENFKTNSLAKAKRLSAGTGRYTFIKFGAEWCVSCKLMESTALVNPTVADLLDSKFVVLDVNIDKPKGYKIKEEFYVEKLPTLIILDESGNQVSRQEGALGTSGLIEMLSIAAQHIFLNEESVTTRVKDEKVIQGK